MEPSADDTHAAPAAPLVSVLIAAWNAAGTIGPAIESVLAERQISLECVVVDDGSTDATADVVEAVTARDSRVVLVRSPANEGVSAARNRGLATVRGTWLTFLDADDTLPTAALAALVQAARQDGTLAVVGQRRWTDGTRTWVSWLYDNPDIREPGRKSLARATGLVYYASGTGKLFHRSCWEGLAFDGRVAGDQAWTLIALLRAGDRIRVIPDVVYAWRRPPRGVTGTSLTSTSRASGSRGVEVAPVAVSALEAVSSEAARLLAPADARAVSVRYAERLLRSDLGMHLSGALRRRDPALPGLLAAIEAFVAAAPPGLLAASDALARDIVEPPLRSWWRLPDVDRDAYRSLVRTARTADPDLVRHARPLSRLGVRHAGEGGPAMVVGQAGVIVSAAWRRAVAVVRRLTRGVRGG